LKKRKNINPQTAITALNSCLAPRGRGAKTVIKKTTTATVKTKTTIT